ncbi:VOC family protein [Staphylococcus sp. ACRSN]|uniref:VOC family protein n=1 Tax=Staphylococcus sp. ACRSN TaxID=2918214 RepID=UPI001EF1D3BC|nr:VOC family protein [Staphylococcus sp. ACRSN]MCG7338046.1 VOC family protein [Staphylococcus sp. ACRSN]
MSFHDEHATQVTNITLNVKDLETMIHFYQTTLGFSPIDESSTSITFKVGDGGHTLTLNELSNGRQPSLRESGLFHIAYLLPSRSDLADFLYHVTQLGIQVGGGDHLVSEALYFNDPEGNGIEIYQDRDAKVWQWEDEKVKMDTLAVDVNTLLTHQSQEGWRGLPSGAKIGHLHLKTIDINKAYQFYVEQLGLELVSTLPNALFMSTNHYHHHIAANTWQSSILRTENNNTLGLTSIDLYKPNTDHTRLLSPEGFNITIHSDKSTVPE